VSTTGSRTVSSCGKAAEAKGTGLVSFATRLASFAGLVEELGATEARSDWEPRKVSDRGDPGESGSRMQRPPKREPPPQEPEEPNPVEEPPRIRRELPRPIDDPPADLPGTPGPVREHPPDKPAPERKLVP
jgi:hypothetical protein